LPQTGRKFQLSGEAAFWETTDRLWPCGSRSDPENAAQFSALIHFAATPVSFGKAKLHSYTATPTPNSENVA